ncbi:MAG: hypothetical protein KJ634_02025 [Gammaproteobacteria bacterium]|nr:hypothetical protein [Gammaproteobacteria bacterium]MBU1414377.1 hypothetical protein [Gammaproteobacteria bacterium]
MKSRSATLVVACLTAIIAVAPACADPDEGRIRHRFLDRNDRVEGTRAERIERIRDWRNGESSFHRLSPEERRQLRHDIRAAREGVYRRQRAVPDDPPNR